MRGRMPFLGEKGEVVEVLSLGSPTVSCASDGRRGGDAGGEKQQSKTSEYEHLSAMVEVSELQHYATKATFFG